MQKIFFLFSAISGSAVDYQCKDIVDQHLSKYDTLMDKYQLLLETNSQQKVQIQSYENEIINGLQMEILSLKTNFESRISALETLDGTKEQEIKTLKTQQTDLIENSKIKYQVLDGVKELAEATADDFSKQVEELVKKQSETENEIKILQSWNGRIEQSMVYANKPYFTANRQGSSDINPANDIVPFENVLDQNGEDYNPDTGTFTAKTNGVYLFSYTIDYASGSSYTTYLMHNHDIVCHSHQQTGSSSYMQNNGCAAVMTLKTGDTVYVKIDTTIYSTTQNIFTGVQLWATSTTGNPLMTTASTR
jgi:hypothetical protein